MNGIKNKHHDLVSPARDALLPFGSTYLCEEHFPPMTVIKTNSNQTLSQTFKSLYHKVQK